MCSAKKEAEGRTILFEMNFLEVAVLQFVPTGTYRA